MRSRLVSMCLFALVCSSVIAGGVAATDHTGPYQIATDQPEPDNTVTRIDLRPNGDAVWTIQFRTRLSTSAATEKYEAFQAAFSNDTSQYLGPFEERMTAVVAGANQQYDREMRAVEFQAKTSVQEVPNRWGIVSFQFRWEGFAAQNDEQWVVGDVFAGGLFISEGDVLEIAAPEGYTVSSSAPAPDETTDGVVQWSGREDFADGRPRVVAAPVSALPVDSTLIPAIVGLVVVVAVGVLAVRRHRSTSEQSTGSDQLPTDEAAVDDDHTGPATASDASPSDVTTDAEAPTGREYDLVTNESQVVDVLEQHDGQMKQADIVDALDWSKSKTSRVLSEMADDGAIEKIRIGRENVIRLPKE
ncbi:helix-turn-helix transcriptional regulator [Halohasta salina]|uniref:helix-turn-helix transcriptional regulator n=1 Tax=Halohasta salina TaxID=2961621 RepID=UPI0020A2C281|nr:helix-turn-helix domain-containing protein [Halohasta salina]